MPEYANPSRCGLDRDIVQGPQKREEGLCVICCKHAADHERVEGPSLNFDRHCAVPIELGGDCSERFLIERNLPPQPRGRRGCPHPTLRKREPAHPPASSTCPPAGSCGTPLQPQPTDLRCPAGWRKAQRRVRSTPRPSLAGGGPSAGQPERRRRARSRDAYGRRSSRLPATAISSVRSPAVILALPPYAAKRSTPSGPEDDSAEPTTACGLTQTRECV